MARRRAQWAKYQDRIDPSRLVFIDEELTQAIEESAEKLAECGVDASWVDLLETSAPA